MPRQQALRGRRLFADTPPAQHGQRHFEAKDAGRRRDARAPPHGAPGSRLVSEAAEQRRYAVHARSALCALAPPSDEEDGAKGAALFTSCHSAPPRQPVAPAVAAARYAPAAAHARQRVDARRRAQPLFAACCASAMAGVRGSLLCCGAARARRYLLSHAKGAHAERRAEHVVMRCAAAGTRGRGIERLPVPNAAPATPAAKSA